MTEPTAIERGYIEQGYELPDGVTWQDVHELRGMFNHPEHIVPLGIAPGVIAWGVPFIDGKPLARLMSA